jgi:hypothetical protein
MAGVAKERIKDWMRRRFPPKANFVSVFECADVTTLLEPTEPRAGLVAREGMLFGSRDHAAPAPRKEVVILTSVLASYSVERIITTLERHVIPNLDSRPELRVLVGDNLRVFSWGQSSTGAGEAETEPCEAPQPSQELT